MNHAVVELRAAAGHVLERGLGVERRPGRPAFGRRAAPGSVDQADRHAEGLLHVDAEEVRRGAETTGRLRGAARPAALAILLRAFGPDVRDGEQADLRMVGGRDVLLGMIGRTQVHFHVRLARADPELAEQHVGQRDPVLAGGIFDHDLMRSAGGGGREPGFPAAVGTGLDGDRFVVELDGKFFSRLGGAPERVFHVALEQQVAGKDGRDAQIGPGGGAERQPADRDDEAREMGPESVEHGRLSVGWDA